MSHRGGAKADRRVCCGWRHALDPFHLFAIWPPDSPPVCSGGHPRFPLGEPLVSSWKTQMKATKREFRCNTLMDLSYPSREKPRRPPYRAEGGQIWREHGALAYQECVAEDVEVGSYVFPRSVKLKPGETVVFSWIVFKSRAHRDAVNAKVMADPRLQA